MSLTPFSELVPADCTFFNSPRLNRKGDGLVTILKYSFLERCRSVSVDASGNMATGGHGIVISVLAFVIVYNLCPSSETFSDNKRCFNVLSEERCDVVSIGYGRNIIFSLLHLHSSRPSISKHHSNAGKFAIILCLLLSGDIHPCPGPNGEVCPSFNKGVLDSGSYLAERNSAVVQVRVSCSDRVPNINTMANNISHLFMDDGVVVMGDEAAAKSSLERTVCRRGRLVDQKGAEHDKSFDEETLPASRCSVDLFGDYFNTKGLHFVHLNIRSLLPKIDEIRCLLKNCKVGIFCLTETWLDSSVTNNEIKVDNSNVIRKDRNRQGGGVCIFIRSDINFNVLDINVEQELLFLNLLLPATKPILFGVCYHPPSQNNFYEGLEFVLNNNNDDLAQECIIMGDFNTNISNRTGDNFKALQSLCQSFHLTQIINKSTRVWEGGESTIDLILVSDEKYISQKGVIEYGISDHNIIFCTRKRSKIRFSNHKTVRIRSLKKYNIEVFKDYLKRVNWNDIQNISIVDDARKFFKVVFLKVVDKIAPLRQVRVKQRASPWMDQKILEILNNRNRALSIYRRTKNQEDHLKFKALRNLGQKNIKESKRNFIKEQILENKEDPKSLWKVLNRFHA